jgi:hypothetical protein
VGKTVHSAIVNSKETKKKPGGTNAESEVEGSDEL